MMKCQCCEARTRRGGVFDKNCPRCRVQHVAMQPTEQLQRGWITYYERRFGMREGARLRRILWRWWELTRAARERKKQARIVQGKVAGKKTAQKPI